MAQSLIFLKETFDDYVNNIIVIIQKLSKNINYNNNDNNNIIINYCYS